MCIKAEKDNFRKLIDIKTQTKELTSKVLPLEVKKLIKANALLAALIISMNCIPNYSYAASCITDYIQSNYGSGDATLNFNIDNQSIKYNYRNNYGSGSSLYNYNANTYDEQNIKIDVRYSLAQTEKITNTTDFPTLPAVYKDIIQPGNGTGGALSNNAKIDNIDSYIFIHNSNRDGGGINNDPTGSIVIKNTLFVNNIANGGGQPEGGAIFSRGTLDIYSTDFVGNISLYRGGALSNNGTIKNIKDSNFIANTSYGHSGAINNSDGEIINNIENTSFILNSTPAKDDAGAITNGLGGTIDTIKSSVFIANKAYDWGGAIRNNGGTITSIIDTDFIQNKITNKGGAIFSFSTIKSISGSNFVGNTSENYGGAISLAVKNTTGTIETISNSSFISNSAGMYGGAISNEGTIGEILNTAFEGNRVNSTSDIALGGAIYTKSDLNVVANDGITIFKDNYTESTNGKDDNAIYLDNSNGTLTFNLKNNGQIYLYDNIRGSKTNTTDGNGNILSTEHYNINISGDNTGTFYLLNDLHEADVTIGNINLNTINNSIHTYNFNSLTLDSDIKMLVDVDLAKNTMDRITANSYGEHSGTLTIIGMNIMSDMKAKQDVTEILFADAGLKDYVDGAIELPENSQTTFYTPIFKYNAVYDKREDEGYFIFTRGDKLIQGSTGNTSDRFNPAVLASPTSASVGAVGTLNATFNYSFNHADTFMNSPAIHRIATKTRNHYTIADIRNNIGRPNPLFLEQDEYAGVWVKPYTTFETISLKNGPKVDSISYGTLIGFDSELETLKNGWDRVITGYVGYNGASQNYSNVDSIQNGGLVGSTVTLYKGNFFNATTLSVGASVANINTMYGNEDLALLMSGLGNKTGYNFEFIDGKLILQPNMLVSYSFVNVFDYTNAAGVKINNNPLHVLQLAPGIKVIGNTKEGWQPYASVNMIWNLMGETDATANNHKLPEMSIKPYVQYGVGIQRKIQDKCSAYAQAMIQNGGRNGISLTAGFKWALGKDLSKEKVNKDIKQFVEKTNSKRVLKQTEPEKTYPIIEIKKAEAK